MARNAGTTQGPTIGITAGPQGSWRRRDLGGRINIPFFPTPAGPWRPLLSRRGRDLGPSSASLKQVWRLRGRMCPAIPRVLRGGRHDGGTYCLSSSRDTGPVVRLSSPIVFWNGSSGGRRTWWDRASPSHSAIVLYAPRGGSPRQETARPHTFSLWSPCGAALRSEARDVDADVSARARPLSPNINGGSSPEFVRASLHTIGRFEILMAKGEETVVVQNMAQEREMFSDHDVSGNTGSPAKRPTALLQALESQHRRRRVILRHDVLHCAQALFARSSFVTKLVSGLFRAIPPCVAGEAGFKERPVPQGHSARCEASLVFGQGYRNTMACSYLATHLLSL